MDEPSFWLVGRLVKADTKGSWMVVSRWCLFWRKVVCYIAAKEMGWSLASDMRFVLSMSTLRQLCPCRKVWRTSEVVLSASG